MINIFSLLRKHVTGTLKVYNLWLFPSIFFLFKVLQGNILLFSPKFKIITVYYVWEYILMLAATQAPKRTPRPLQIFQHLHCVKYLTEENASKTGTAGNIK